MWHFWDFRKFLEFHKISKKCGIFGISQNFLNFPKFLEFPKKILNFPNFFNPEVKTCNDNYGEQNRLVIFLDVVKNGKKITK